MANALYAAGKTALETAGINLSSDTIKALLVDTDNADSSKKYVVNLATDAHVSDIASAKRIVAGVALSSKSVTAGVFDAADVTFAALVNGGQNIGAVVLYKDTGTESTSTLIAYLDTGAGFPATPAGTDFVVQWSNGPNKIFSL